jgi:hypothetical protein
MTHTTNTPNAEMVGVGRGRRRSDYPAGPVWDRYVKELRKLGFKISNDGMITKIREGVDHG